MKEFEIIFYDGTVQVLNKLTDEVSEVLYIEKLKKDNIKKFIESVLDLGESNQSRKVVNILNL